MCNLKWYHSVFLLIKLHYGGYGIEIEPPSDPWWDPKNKREEPPSDPLFKRE